MPDRPGCAPATIAQGAQETTQRLKFSKLDERLLAGVSVVSRSTADKHYEMYCTRFSADVMDANGRPLLAIWRHHGRGSALTSSN
ncbi:hypothetical protein D7U83_09160 [Stenotrophomonas maltophilia]|nr:hypothetical protein [Stenotrophomonas maltophilia]